MQKPWLKKLNEDWSFRPDGLGKLRFGMTQEEVRAFDDIYGAVWRERSHSPTEGKLKILEEYIAEMEPAKREQYRQDMEEHHAYISKMLTEYLDSGLDLD